MPALVIKKKPDPSKTSSTSVPRSRVTLSAMIAVILALGAAPKLVSATCSNPKLPLSVTPAMPMLTPTPVARTYGPATRSSVLVTPSSTTDSSTAAPVLLISTPNVPLTATPGTVTSTVACKVPAKPVGRTTKKPEPLETMTGPKPNEISERATLTMVSARALVVCSKTNLPASSMPAIVRRATVSSMSGVSRSSVSAPRISTRTYGPAGRSTTISSPLTTMESRMIAFVLLISMLARASSRTSALPRSMSTVAESLPPMPVGVMTRAPSVIVATARPSPRLSCASVTATTTTRWPLGLVFCSKAKLPVRVWPATVRSISVPSRRRNLPAGSTRRISLVAIDTVEPTALPVKSVLLRNTIVLSPVWPVTMSRLPCPSRSRTATAVVAALKFALLGSSVSSPIAVVVNAAANEAVSVRAVAPLRRYT